MSGGSGSQGDLPGQFDTEMANCRLVRGKTKLQQFDVFQQALSNAVIHFCRDNRQDVQSLISNMEEVEMEQPPMPEESIMESAQGGSLRLELPGRYDELEEASDLLRVQQERHVQRGDWTV